MAVLPGVLIMTAMGLLYSSGTIPGPAGTLIPTPQPVDTDKPSTLTTFLALAAAGTVAHIVQNEEGYEDYPEQFKEFAKTIKLASNSAKVSELLKEEQKETEQKKPLLLLTLLRAAHVLQSDPRFVKAIVEMDSLSGYSKMTKEDKVRSG